MNFCNNNYKNTFIIALCLEVCYVVSSVQRHIQSLHIIKIFNIDFFESLHIIHTLQHIT